MQFRVDEFELSVACDDEVVVYARFAGYPNVNGTDDGDVFAFGRFHESRHKGAVQRFRVVARPTAESGFTGNDAFGQNEEFCACRIRAVNEVLYDGKVFFARFLDEKLGEGNFHRVHRRYSSGNNFSAVLRCLVRCCS